ncbi:hypothetical protein cand_001260 [Cryptosporidium andersoni]|uniref:NF-kappa-B-activating protein C-terminal domain-containing protein n=1 Tax=Cryptosporidium andersoni TaxID=117008 RepID=A0A1J4MT43_9CRYT|nr:hypothetical protein cand_001260 [Cryptosporidium andersoni]
MRKPDNSIITNSEVICKDLNKYNHIKISEISKDWDTLVKWLQYRTNIRKETPLDPSIIWNFGMNSGTEHYFIESKDKYTKFDVKAVRSPSFEREFIPEYYKDIQEVDTTKKDNSINISESDIDNKLDNNLLNTDSNNISDLDISKQDIEFGPQPDEMNLIVSNKNVNYGSALLAGEGKAMAQYVQSGKRIPRRGEIGYTAEEIEEFEKLGYVMSGDLHKRMNAVRIRKESQVYSAEERRAMILRNEENRAQRESHLVGKLRELLKEQKKKL